MVRYQFSSHIVSNADYLNKLAKARSYNKKHALILKATPEQILSIVEICANILNSNFVLNNRQKQKLVKYADIYRNIAKSRTENTAKKRITEGLNQQGGQLAISAILAPVLSVLAQTLLDRVLE